MKVIMIGSILLLALLPGAWAAGTVHYDSFAAGGTQQFRLDNARVELTLIFKEGTLASENLQPVTAAPHAPAPVPGLESDGDFRLQVVWTDWLAPGKMNNGDNPVLFGKKDFRLVDSATRDDNGAKELVFQLKGAESGLELKLIYRLEPDKFYFRRRLALRDGDVRGHWLEKLSVMDAKVRLVSRQAHRETALARIEGMSESVQLEIAGETAGRPVVVKQGGFGQPVALTAGSAGAFWGLEYPAAQNEIGDGGGDGFRGSCYRYYGSTITAEWLESPWLVMALTPDPFVKKWFFAYLDDIRVAPLRPYTLYNSWYDLRSAEYPGVPADNVMNENNVRRLIGLVRENMVEKHGIQLDAFVLDDGWDVYESDWELRPAQFPNGLRPIAAELARTGTALGMWLGPTGGYSLRMKRIDWMKAHGYEVVGQGKDHAMLCLGGERYRRLFAKRTADLIEQADVGYFKWDGIQFSCSEPGHGHPVGIFSGPAILDALIEQCQAARRKKADLFLNITSGTWLSPWWLQYADTIWMDGADYAFAGVPSPTGRDGAMTYRDYVLYDDFSNKGLWFPIANLMTHGIIKGKLESISGREPLEKFTDDVLLYFARGVSMYELYISPDILNAGEWNCISLGLRWARDRFPILRHSEMIGGNPARAETYGYVHFAGKKGMIAARNPGSDGSCLDVVLDPAAGLEADAASLVVEQVYPVRRVWPELYSAGGRLTIPLGAFETSLFEIYPLSEASAPLLAGISSGGETADGMGYAANFFDPGEGVRLLNPEIVREMSVQGKVQDVSDLKGIVPPPPPALTSASFSGSGQGRKARMELAFTIDPTATEAALAILLSQEIVNREKDFPEMEIRLDGRLVTPEVEKLDGAYAWFTVKVAPGRHSVSIQARPGARQRRWSGNLSAWVNLRQQAPTVDIRFSLRRPAALRILPPRTGDAGSRRLSFKIGQRKLDLAS